MKGSILFIFLIPVLGICAFKSNQQVVNDTNTIELSNFSSLSVSSNIIVELVKAETPSLNYEIVGNENIELTTKVINGKLKLKLKDKQYTTSRGYAIKIKLYYVSLDQIGVSAGASVFSKELLESDRLKLSASSAGKIKLKTKAVEVSANASSSGNIGLNGKSKEVVFNCSSGAGIKARALITDNAKINASSGGRVEVHADKKIKINVSSGGSVKYAGKAELDEKLKSSWGSIKKIGT